MCPDILVVHTTVIFEGKRNPLQIETFQTYNASEMSYFRSPKLGSITFFVVVCLKVFRETKNRRADKLCKLVFHRKMEKSVIDIFKKNVGVGTYFKERSEQRHVNTFLTVV